MLQNFFEKIEKSYQFVIYELDILWIHAALIVLCKDHL